MSTNTKVDWVVDPQSGFGLRGSDLAIPGRYSGMIDHEGCPYLVHLEVEADRGQTRCIALKLDVRPDGPAITSTGVRKLPVKEYVDLLTTAVTMRVTPLDGGGFTLEPLEDSRVPGAYKTVGGFPDQDLEAVARVYREAVPSGKPNDAVAKAFNIGASTARRRVREARQAGYDIPPAPRRPDSKKG